MTKRTNARTMQDFARAPHQTQPTSGPVPHAPNAALLIDFDNVTMGIRSDLTKEMKKLLNSDIIRGKVAVQRAYADWRRYPQYIVPLSESAVDLIFAPAYGSSKKNATDIRLAIDALELVFTRPEIGTFILLSGDSDFSSLVLKLKEYGKYVIGVGLRESSSDLLVQNCDEYYSYSALSGLTRTGEGGIAPAEDPWALTERAVRQMKADGDVMRSDRLKQVMLEIDPSFDEKEVGFSKFNRFLAEAASKGALRIKKLENGQYEVVPPGEEPAPGTEPVASRQTRPPRRREPRPEPERRPPPEPEPRAEPEPRPEPEPEPEVEVEVEPVPRRELPLEVPDRTAQGVPGDHLERSYDLLRDAVAAIVREGGAARDSDIKRRMLEMRPNWDESEVGFSKFSRFLRQAHAEEVINLRRTSEGYYEATLPGAEPREKAGRPREDRRREGRPSGRAEREPEAAVVERERAPEPEPAPDTGEETGAEVHAGVVATPEEEQAEPTEAGKEAPTESEVAEPEARPAEPSRRHVAVTGRRGSKRGGAPSGPPPVLPGQTASGAGAKERREAAVSEDTTPGERPAEPVGTEGAPPGGGAFDPDAYNLPTEAGAVIRYLSNSYKGVGQKTAEQLIDAFGANGVFTALATEPDRVREVLGPGRRTDQLMEAWEADLARRRTRSGNGRSEKRTGQPAATPAD